MDYPIRQSGTTYSPLEGGLNTEIILDAANKRFAKAIGNQRYEDVKFEKSAKARRVTLLGG